MFNHPIGSSNAPKKKPQGASPMAQSAAMPGAPPEMEGAEPEDGAQIAEQHGPATEVHVMHEHEMGAHHVSSTHPDGHQHTSDHGSVEEAHEHAKKLATGHGEPDGDEGKDAWDEE